MTVVFPELPADFVPADEGLFRVLDNAAQCTDREKQPLCFWAAFN